MSLLQIILIAVITLVLVGAGVLFVINQEAEKTKRRMQVIQGRSGGMQKQSEKGKADQRRAEIAKKLKETKENHSRQKTTQ